MQKTLTRLGWITLFKALIVAFSVEVIGAVQWELPTQGIQEVQVRAKAAKLTVKSIEGTLLRILITSSKEPLWSQEVLTLDSVTNQKVLKIYGPEEGITVEDTVINIEVPKEGIYTKLVFEDVRAEINSVAQLTLSSLKGRIVAQSTGENVHLSLQKGEIQSIQNKGAMEIEAYGGKVLVKDGQSSIKLLLFNGDLNIEKNSGKLHLVSYSSSAKINDQQGAVQLQWGKGNLSMTDFMGHLEGESQDGTLQIQVKPEARVDLQAMRGRVQVQLPNGSGASLRLKTATGDLIVPSPLKPAREGKYRVVNGKLAGLNKGRVNIHSEEASIIVK